MKYERNIADDSDNWPRLRYLENEFNERNTMTGLELTLLKMAVSAIYDMVKSNNNSLDAQEAKSIMKKHIGDDQTAKDMLVKVVSEVGKKL